MSQVKEKFATQVDGELLSDLRELANKEGRQIQALVEEALTALIEERKGAKARPHVMSAYQKSHARFGQLYKKLAE